MPISQSAIIALAINWGVKAIGALIVLLLGLWVAGRLKNFAIRTIKHSPHLDETLARFIGSLVYYLIVAFVVIAVLSMFGIQTTGLAALIGASGLAIGMALQGTLGHLASGVMLMAFRPFSVGDFIEAGGHSGTIKEITLFTTIMATADNVKIIIPNGDIWSGSIKNFSGYSERRVDFVFGISYDSDIDKAIDSIKTEIAKDKRIKETPAKPQLVVGNLGDSSVDIIVRVWCHAGDYWGIKFDLTKAVKERFDADGIDIPFPTQTHYQVVQN